MTMTAIGLILDIVGVGILFFYGPPQPVLETGVSFELEAATPVGPNGETVAELDAVVSRRRKHFLVMSRIGLGRILVGFALQLYDSIC